MLHPPVIGTAHREPERTLPEFPLLGTDEQRGISERHRKMGKYRPQRGREAGNHSYDAREDNQHKQPADWQCNALAEVSEPPVGLVQQYRRASRRFVAPLRSK